MSEASSFDFFLSHSAKNESVMRPRAERSRAVGLRRSRVLVLCMSAHGFGRTGRTWRLAGFGDGIRWSRSAALRFSFFPHASRLD